MGTPVASAARHGGWTCDSHASSNGRSSPARPARWGHNSHSAGSKPRGGAPPDTSPRTTDPTSREVDLLTALAWAAAAGAVVGIAQVLAHRGAAALWTQAVGSRPPRKRRRLGQRR
ncbi:MAG: DUF4235 domain-containing protein [Gemmatimonadaceae bacterium]